MLSFNNFSSFLLNLIYEGIKNLFSKYILVTKKDNNWEFKEFSLRSKLEYISWIASSTIKGKITEHSLLIQTDKYEIIIFKLLSISSLSSESKISSKDSVRSRDEFLAPSENLIPFFTDIYK